MAKAEDDDLEAELDAAAAAADAEDELPEDASDRLKPQIRKGKPGRKRKHRPTGEFSESKSNVMAFGEHTEARAIASKDAAVIWDAVLQQAREQNRPPELIGISVTRLGMGAFPSEAQNLNQINGDLVCGDEHTSPGDALVRYITDVYHMPSAKSPKLYKLGFHFRTGTRNQIQAPVAELRLGDPAEIQAQRDAEARFLQQKAINEAVKGARAGAATGMGGPPPPWPQQPSQYPGPGYQTPGYPQSQYYPPQPIPGASPELEAMRREMATMMGAINERTRLEGLAPPPAPVAPAPPAPSAEEQAAVIARTVAQTLVGLGFTPQLAQKLNSPALSPAAVQGAITDPLELLDKAFEQMDRFRKLDKRMEERYAPDEEDEPPKPVAIAPVEATKVEVDKTLMKPIPIPVGFTGGKQIFYGERGPDESVIDYGVRLFMHNPETGAAFLGQALKGLSGSAIGQAVAGLISKGMPGMASMVQAQHAQLNGSANGVANGAAAASQTVPAPPPATWGAPKI